VTTVASRSSRPSALERSSRRNEERRPGNITREDFSPTALRDFWTFVGERQSIWDRRIRRGLPPPWTHDTILATNRFTNVYRELDPGTRYVLTEILEVDAPKPDRVFNTMVYRLIGRAETHRALGFMRLCNFDPSEFESRLKYIRARQEPVFTAAYMVSGYRFMGSHDKIVNVSRLFARLHSGFDGFYEDLARSRNLAEAFGFVRDQEGFGSFLAYQVLVDLTYGTRRDAGGVLSLSPARWAIAGPGARKGIRILTIDAFAPELEVMTWLQSHQREEFSRNSVDFRFLEDEDGNTIEISLPNIQNCLCEFYKYSKIRDGTGRARRRFRPETGRVDP